MMDVTPQKLKEEQKKGTPMMVVDLQAPEAYGHAHVPGAVNIPMKQFHQQYPTTVKDQDIAVVLYGEYDELGKGSEAAEVLEAAGFTKVGRLVGGLRGWQEAGYPTEGGKES